MSLLSTPTEGCAPPRAAPPSDDAATIAVLRRQLAARDKTIGALMQRVEDRVASSSTAFTALQQNVALEKVVAEKTRELGRERQELQRALSELRCTQAQLLQAQKLESIGQLAAGVAHEINTPIQYVSDNVAFVKRCFDLLMDVVRSTIAVVEDRRDGAGSAQLLAAADQAIKRARLDYLRKQGPAALEQALEGLQRVVIIVAAMKEFSHPSQNEKEPIRLDELIKTTLTVARNEWKYVADVQLQLDETLPPVPCLRNEMNQVLLNLVVNAAHAIADVVAGDPAHKGRITVSTRRVGNNAEICIADTGGGIPESIRSRVFDPFFTTKGVGKGTGQGLAIAYSAIVEKHGGRIWFDSEVGKGTRFHVQLPLQVQERAA